MPEACPVPSVDPPMLFNSDCMPLHILLLTFFQRGCFILSCTLPPLTVSDFDSVCAISHDKMVTC